MGVQTETYDSIPRDARNWARGCHLIALVGLPGNGLGFVVGPLIVWLVKREDHPFIDEQGKDSVSFQITMIGAIIAGVKAANGEHWRYPLTIRFIK